MQSVWDRLWGGETRVNDVSGQRTNRTTRGTFTLGTPAAIGGGGGVIMQVVSYHQDATNGDYLVCQPDGGGATVNVAVDMHLQSSIVTQTNPDGTTWTYSTYVAATQTRLRNDGVTEYISPPFITSDRIGVQPCSNTGVTVSGKKLTQIAPTGRQWASTSA